MCIGCFEKRKKPSQQKSRGASRLRGRSIALLSAMNPPKGASAAPAIVTAVKKGDVGTLKKIIDKPDAGLDAKGDKGRNLLMFACAEGQMDVAKLFLSKKASHFPINAVDDDGNSALMLACEGGWSKVVEFLFKQNPPPKVDIVNKKGNTV